jgi:hypothetical protein
MAKNEIKVEPKEKVVIGIKEAEVIQKNGGFRLISVVSSSKGKVYTFVKEEVK